MADILYTHSPEETEKIGEDLAKSLKKGDFVALYGDLGVGKTAFVRGMARVLAPHAAVTSPSYSLCNTYRGNIMFYHFDLYRLSSEDDLESIGYYDLIENGITAAEWCENIPTSIPEHALRVTISRV
ncbi:MAG TPA: tRNA (adenosine(37)-N6)-threonylcarbamoyltransferase complex ATPase subunit type 1 TsaE, partial [Clostridiales bacterium]|nr:tRNA (adenosine(37)-N6)-threonylcarbamoyltransferase complex ATPase subunit type 1 TsaE [Clostridiales bacterium]